MAYLPLSFQTLRTSHTPKYKVFCFSSNLSQLPNACNKPEPNSPSRARFTTDVKTIGELCDVIGSPRNSKNLEPSNILIAEMDKQKGT